MPGFIGLDPELIAAGVRDDFRTTYDATLGGVIDDLSDAMRMDVPFNHRTERFGMLDSVGSPERFDEGNEAIPEEGVDSRSFSVTVYDYGKRVSWRVKDREDNKVGDLRGKAIELGDRFGLLTSKIFVELLTSAPSLLPAIPNAPDGGSPFSATNGAGSARFQLSGGNIQTGTGIASSAAVQKDFYLALNRYDSMKDTKGEFYWPSAIRDESYTIFFNSANREVFNLAFFGTAVHSVVSTTGATVSNTILVGGIRAKLVPTPYLTDDDWFIFKNTARIKPFFRGIRRPLEIEEALKTTNNSDMVRDIAKEYVQFTVREAYGVNEMFASVKVNNN